MTANAGWYQDPHQPNELRYWNGQEWTEHRAPKSDPAAMPARKAEKEESRRERKRRAASKQPRVGDVKVVRLSLLSKRGTEKKLQSLAEEGWSVTSAASVGTEAMIVAYTLKYTGVAAPSDDPTVS